MRNLTRKLHSNSGASMMMALLLMFVALMVSAVIIAAAVSSAHSVRGDREQQQAYLTVSSAASLMRDSMQSDECKYTKSVKTYWNDRKYTSQNNQKATVTTETDGSGAFWTILKAGMQTADTGAVFSKTYTVSAEGYEDVTANVVMEKKTETENGQERTYYALTVWFTGGTSPNECRICLTAEGSSDTKTTKGTERYYPRTYYYTKTETTTVSWSNIKLTRSKEAMQGA